MVEQLILDHLGHDAVQHLGRDFAGVLEERGNNIESTKALPHRARNFDINFDHFG